jgi:Zn-dependent protease
VEEQTILVLIQIVEANGTIQPTLDSRKSDGVDGIVVIAASRWQGLLVFLLLVILLGCLLLGCLLLGRFPLGCLLPLESVKPSIQGFVAAKIHINLVLQLFNPLF